MINLALNLGFVTLNASQGYCKLADKMITKSSTVTNYFICG